MAALAGAASVAAVATRATAFAGKALPARNIRCQVVNARTPPAGKRT